MEEYAWMKNKAVVDRLYYSERVLEFTTFFGGLFTGFNLLFVKKGYFPNVMRNRILPTFKWWAIINLVTIPVLLRPLTKEEIAVQWRKRLIMGKWLYTLYHLDEPTEAAPAE